MLTTPRWLHQTTINVCIVLASLIITALILEALLRLSHYNPFGELFDNEMRLPFLRPSNNPQRIYEATPNSHGFGWGTNVSINEFGFRGKTVALQKPAHTTRIIVLGDSIAFGNNLPDDANFSILLEKKFLAQDKHVEVLNLSLGGYDTLQEIATLQDTGLQLQPDIVVLSYCINDIGTASGNLNYIKRLQKYGSPIYKLRLAQWLRVQFDKIDQRSYLTAADDPDSFYQTYKNYFASIDDDKELAVLMSNLSQAIEKSGGRASFAHDYTDPQHVMRLRFALQQLRSLQQQHHFSVAVIVFPFLLERADNQAIFQQVYRIIEHEFQQQSFPVINLYPLFYSEGLDTLLLKKNDGIHPNQRGNQLTADLLYNTLSTSIKN